MRAFLKIFLALLIPVSLIIATLLTLYYTFEYSFTQAMSLGVLYGLFSGIIITIILTFAYLAFKGNRTNIQNKLKNTQKENGNNEDLKKSIEYKHMFLLNKELTFEIVLTTIKDQFSHSATTHNIDKGSIDLKIQDEIISITITSLTKHTSQIIINDMNNSNYIQDIFSSLKEKEHSFLQY